MQPRAKESYQKIFDDSTIRAIRYQKDLKTWQTGMEKKEAYHQTLYGDFKAPLPDHPLEIIKNEPDIPTPQPSYRPSPF